METRRHSSMSSLMVASVFILALLLFVSCGIPTYIVPTVKFSSISSEDNKTSFRVSYSSESSVSGSVDKIGLLLIYYHEDSSNANSERSRIPSNFKSTYLSSTYDGRVVYIEDIDDPVVSYTYNNTKHNAYAFTLSGNAIDAPYYTYLPFGGLDNESDVSLTINLTFNSDDNTVSLSDSDSQSTTLGFNSSFEPNYNDYIRVFAAVSVQSENYSNLYWSPLTYVGAMQVPNED